MGSDVPGTSGELLRATHVRTGDARAVPHPHARAGAGVAAAIAAAVLVLAPLGVSGGAAAAGRALPWVLVTGVGCAAWAAAGQRVRGRLRSSARMLAAAALVAGLAHVLEAYAARYGPPGPVPVALYAAGVPYLMMAAGAALALARRTGGAAAAWVGVDALLLLLAAVLGAMRWVVEPAVAGGAAGGDLVLLLLPCLAVVPVLPAAQVVLQRRPWLFPRAAPLLLAATTLLTAAAILAFPSSATGAVRGHRLDPLALGGWAAFALSGFAAGGQRPGWAVPTGQAALDRLRKLVVPVVGIFLVVTGLDLAGGAQPLPATLGVFLALGAVLALRTAQALMLADRDAEAGQQLARTHALVEVTHALAGTTDLDATLRVISESAAEVLGTRAAGIELVSEDGSELVTRAAVGMSPEVLGLRFPVEGSFTGWVVRHGEPRATLDPSRDPYIQPQSRAYLGEWPVAAAPIRFRGETLGALYACIRSEPFEAEELQLLGALAEQAAIAIQNARLFEQVMILSHTDPLTGLANRRQLERELTREFAAARRGRRLVAVIFDLDSFKDYNDAYGHLAGDEALQAFAATLRSETRAMNFAARYGGDEFVALLSDTEVAGARAFTKRIRDRFRAACLELGRGEITVSAGLAAWAPDMEQPDELLRRADMKLYTAKSDVRT